MTTEQFAYWLQGYSEIAGEAPSKEQWKVIQDHLKTAFKKITPDSDVGYPLPAAPSPTPGIVDQVWPFEWDTGKVIF